jgi:PAS domain S-box-containing protein
MVFEQCFSSSAVMLLIDTKTGEIANANNAALNFYGYPFEEICNLNISDITVPSSNSIAFNFDLPQSRCQHLLKDKTVKEIILFNTLIDHENRKINWAIIQDVTEEKRLANELNTFFRIVDESDTMISIADMSRKITYLNKKMRKTFAISETANLSNFETQDFYTNKGKIVSKLTISETKKKDFWKGENEMQNFDGTKIQVIQSGIVIKNEKGLPEYTCITSIDISEKIQAELDNFKSEDIDRLILEKINGFAYCKIIYNKEIACDFEYIKVNKAFEIQIGFSNISGKKLSEIAPSFFQNETNFIERCAYVASSGVSETFEIFLESLNLWHSVSIHSLEQDHFIMSFEVINDRKEKEKLLEKLLTRYHSFLETSSDGIHLIDKNGNLIEANESFCKMLGYSKIEIQHMNISDWDIKWPKEDLITLISVSIAQSSIYQTKHIRKDGTIIDVEINAIGIQIDKIDYLYASARDITERIENERTIAESNIQLKKINTDLESFAFIASHDLKAPLNVVNGFLKLLQAQKESLTDAEKEEYLKYIMISVEQMNVLITDLLKYSRIGNNKDEYLKVNLTLLVKSIMMTLADTIEHNNASIHIGQLPFVFANQTLIYELFLNLINNALKYHDGSKPLQIEVGYTDKADMHQFFVRDNGLGIAAENLEKIFIMFKRLHIQSEFKGTGIGLALCKRIVESHDGNIWVESELGKGCTFYFTIKKIEQDI